RLDPEAQRGHDQLRQRRRRGGANLTINVDPSTVNFNSNQNLAAMNLAAGTVTVAPTFTVTSAGAVSVSTAGSNHISGAGTFNATGGFNIAAGSTLSYDGSGTSGTFNINGTQAHGVSSILNLNGGETNIASDPGG